MKLIQTATMLGLSALVMSGCSPKITELPPEPIGTATATGGGATNLGRIAPGSQQDFVQSVASDRVYFDTDRFDLDNEDQATIQSQAEWLSRYPTVRVTIEGHCDERGTRDYNLALGERRANAAKNFLASLGVSPARISTISYGKERPEALGSDEASWARNRRAVTITVQ